MREHPRVAAVLWILIGFAVLCLVLSFAQAADAHDAPTGWAYPEACCSGYDCRQVGDAGSSEKVRVLETPQGYQISTTGEIIPYGDEKLQPSPDGFFHWCSKSGADDTATICLFVPPPAY